MNNKAKIAIVVQRYGKDVSGGAELHARWLAEHLQKYFEVHVLTTCSLDYLTWDNEFSAGVSVENDIIIHRFETESRRDIKKFFQTGFIFQKKHTFKDAVDWLWEQGPIVPNLIDYIEANRLTYEAYIFFSFEYATTYLGVQLVADRAILIPTAHDHPYTYLPFFRPIFHLPAAIAYNTMAEKQLLNRTSRNRDALSQIVGIGIDVPEHVDGERFINKYDLPADFLLYVGRIEKGKNVTELIQYYQRYFERNPLAPPLVMIGKEGDATVPKHPNIIHLGMLSEQDKFDALQAATLFVLPSMYESLSMVLLEAWLMGTPVLVNGLCEVTKIQTKLSNGGLYYLAFEEFCVALDMLLQDKSLQYKLGQQGMQFAQRNYDWDVIEKKFLLMIKAIMERTADSLTQTLENI